MPRITFLMIFAFCTLLALNDYVEVHLSNRGRLLGIPNDFRAMNWSIAKAVMG